jgi:hypothetical protein
MPELVFINGGISVKYDFNKRGKISPKSKSKGGICLKKCFKHIIIINVGNMLQNMKHIR